MSRVLWFAAGIGAGFLVAHKINKTARGRAFFAEVDQRIQEFAESVGEGFRARADEVFETAHPATDE